MIFQSGHFQSVKLSGFSSIKVKFVLSHFFKQFKLDMDQEVLKQWGLKGAVKHEQWRKKEVKDQIKAPCFQQLEYQTNIFTQVIRLSDPKKNWAHQTKSIRKKLYYYIMTQSVLSFPEDYKNQCYIVRNNIDTPNVLLKNIKNLSHLKQAIKISQTPIYNLMKKEYNRAEIIIKDKQLLHSYCEQFFVYLEFLRLHIAMVLKKDEEIRQEYENNKIQLQNDSSSKKLKSTGVINQVRNQSYIENDGFGISQIAQNYQNSSKKQPNNEKDQFELQYQNWLKEISLFKIGEVSFRQI